MWVWTDFSANYYVLQFEEILDKIKDILIVSWIRINSVLNMAPTKLYHNQLSINNIFFVVLPEYLALVC